MVCSCCATGADLLEVARTLHRRSPGGVARSVSASPVDIAPMSNPNHEDQQPFVFNHVDRAIVTGPDPIDVALFASVLFRSWRTRFVNECLNRAQHPCLFPSRERTKLLLCPTLKPDRVGQDSPSLPQSICTQRLSSAARLPARRQPLQRGQRFARTPQRSAPHGSVSHSHR